MLDNYDTDALRRDVPLSDYLPSRGVELKPEGREWRACCPFHTEKTPSFTVRVGRDGAQRYHCFGCGVQGDVVDFVTRFDGVSFPEACEQLGGTRDAPTSRPERAPVKPPHDPYAEWKAIRPPSDVVPFQPGVRTPPIWNPKQGKEGTFLPVLVHAYRTEDGRPYAFVIRYEIAGKKLFATVAWCQNRQTGELRWSQIRLAEPAHGKRPYGLEILAQRPGAPVVLVGGEKCADALNQACPGLAALSWHGGEHSAAKTDWRSIQGRRVLVWPDADEPGAKAAATLSALIPGAQVARPDEIERPKGWDCADAIADGWTGADCVAWLERQTAPETGRAELNPREQIEPEPDEDRFAPPEDAEPIRAKPRPRAIPGSNVVSLNGGNVGGESAPGYDWRADIKYDKKGFPEKKNPTNWFLYIKHHPKFKGMFAKNTFTNTITVRRRPPWDTTPGAWVERAFSDDDATRTAMELDNHDTGDLQLSHVNAGVTISAVAEANKFNPVADYLRGLQWDGICRLRGGAEQDGWLCHYFGADALTYHRTVGMRWLIAGAARALTEGAAVEKVDTMLILEGPQGFFKSTALETLGTLNGQRLYTDSVETLAGKDAALQTNGVLIVEIAELNGLSKQNVDAVKKWMSSKVDRYRPPYGKHVVEVPRRFIVAGTVNPSGPGYLHDPTGARRFWPVLCQKPCDIAALRRDRDQLWAEAVHLFDQGEPWHLQPDEIPDAEYQQSMRYQDDPWAERIDKVIEHARNVTLSEIVEAIGMPLWHVKDEHKRRISDHMKARRWTFRREGTRDLWEAPR